MKSTNNKGSANMWWIIIGAVIALVVMIILIVMFTDKGGRLGTELLDCGSKGGTCVPESQCIKEKGTVSTAFDCTPNTNICCFGLSDKQKIDFGKK